MNRSIILIPANYYYEKSNSKSCYDQIRYICIIIPYDKCFRPSYAVGTRYPLHIFKRKSFISRGDCNRHYCKNPIVIVNRIHSIMYTLFTIIYLVNIKKENRYVCVISVIFSSEHAAQSKKKSFFSFFRVESEISYFFKYPVHFLYFERCQVNSSFLEDENFYTTNTLNSTRDPCKRSEITYVQSTLFCSEKYSQGAKSHPTI